MNPLVTIAIPAYKANFLKESIRSALEQSYSNIEVIVVNDQSPENLECIVREFKDSRLKYFVNEVNIGGKDPVANWNNCLAKASGDFFCLLCDDDYYEPDFVESLLVLAEKYPECNVFRARAKNVDAENRLMGYFPASPEFETGVDYLIDLVGGRRFQTITEFMYRRLPMVQKGGYSPLPMAWCADHMSVVKLAGNEGIASTTSLLVGFRTSGINITSEYGKNIREKVNANALYSIWVKSVADNQSPEISAFIKSRRTLQHANEMTEYLFCAKIKDWIFLWKRKNQLDYYIPKRCFYKAFFKKIVYLLGKRNCG